MLSSQQRPTTSPQVSWVPTGEGWSRGCWGVLSSQAPGLGLGKTTGPDGSFIFNGVVRAWVCLFIPLPLLFTGVAPFSGATTGTGGRIRDVQCTGRGAHVVAGTAGYCFGNLHIPGPVSFPSRHLCFQIPCPGRRRTLISLTSKVILGHHGMEGSRVTGFFIDHGPEDCVPGETQVTILAL